MRRIDVEAAHERSVFYLSVTVPQLDVVNQGVWIVLEDEASLAARAGDVWVIAGPVFAPALGGGASIVVWGAGLAVPTHFYRIHVRAKSPGGALEARAWLVPNTQEAGRQATPESFATTVALIERVTGLRFFTEGLTAEARARLVDEVGAAW